MACIVYENTSSEYGHEVPGSKWTTPPNLIENDQTKILWSFQVQTDKMLMTNQLKMVMVNKQERKPIVINIRRKQHEMLEEYQGLKEELE